MIDFLDLINVVKEAGDKTKEFFGHSVMERSKENDDLVTNADLYVDEYIFNYINSNFPDHGFDSEEREMIRPEAEYIWILDPIDGTKYFQQSIPLYSIALALQFKQKLVQGIVYNPQVNEFFYASSLNQDGAKKNGLSIYCSNDKPFEELSIIMELPNRNNSDESIKNALAIMEALMQKVKRVRVFGVGAISLCYCAMGGFDVYLNLGVTRKHYDYAAGRVILEQAGGKFYQTNQLIIGGRDKNVRKVLDFLHINV